MRFAAPAALALALAGAARAEDAPLVSLSFGTDVLQASAGQVLQASATDDYGNHSVKVRLDPLLDAEMARLTAAHVDDQGTLSICGRVMSEPVLRDVITTAEFVVTVATAAEAAALVDALTRGDCNLTAGS